MEIRTTECGRWAVWAEWLGQERAVYTADSIFACIAWREENA